MAKELMYENRKLVIMIGGIASGKSYYVNKFYVKTHQLISEQHLDASLAIENDSILAEKKYAIFTIIARALMLRGLPIVVDEKNLDMESIYIWKKLAITFNYSIKGIVFDTPKEVCLKRIKGMLDDEPSENIYKTLDREREQLDELLSILKMKHQKLLENYIIIPYGGEKNEVL
jgi:predicted kinase